MTDIDKLEALERAATPAPWVYDDGIDAQDEYTQVRARPESVGPFGADAARTDDCIFLAELRNAAPALFAEIRRLRAIEAAARDAFHAIEEAAWEMDTDIDLQMRASPDVYELWKCALAETKRLKAALAAKEAAE